MREQGTVAHVNCPRCNARAPKIFKRGGDVVSFWIQCEKCMLLTMDGVASWSQWKRAEEQAALMKKYAAAKTPAERGRIMKRVQELSDQEDAWFKSL